MIQTVLGLLDPGKLGFCHSHEHLFVRKGHPYTVNPAIWMDDYHLTVKEMESFREAGGSAIIDAQPGGCGRMERELMRASAETGVHVAASTGFHKLSFYPGNHWIRTLDREELAEVFIGELRSGMWSGTDRHRPGEAGTERTQARAGLIKTAIDAERMHDPDIRWFEAAAAAARETGAPVMCHTEGAGQALWLCGLYERLGVPLSRIIICHLDRELTAMDVQIELAQRGIYLEYDTIGRFKYHDDEPEARWICAMLEAGLEDRILLGLDTTRSRMAAYGGDIGLTYLTEAFLPLLERTGATRDQIHKLMIRNPSKAFSISRI